MDSSVYYNISLFNENKKPERFVKNETSFDYILDKQSNYEVGIKRFKLPATDIDTFRIYPNRYILGLDFYNSSENAGSNFYAVDIYSEDALTKDNFDSDMNQYYMPISSQKQFASMLNRALLQLFHERCLNGAGGGFGSENVIRYTKQEGSCSSATNTLNTRLSGATPIFSETITPIATAPTGTDNARKVFYFEFKVDSIGFSSGNGNLLLKDLSFIVVANQYNGETDNTGALIKTGERAFTLGTGFGAGYTIAQFTQAFPNGLKISSEGRVFNTGQSNFLQTPNFMPLDDIDYKILGNLGEYATYDFYVLHNKVVTPTTQITITADFSAYQTNADFYVNTLKDGETNALIGIPPPFFDLDPSTKALTYSTTLAYQNQGKINIYMNDNLQDIVGFDFKYYPLETEASFVEIGTYLTTNKALYNFQGGTLQLDLQTKNIESTSNGQDIITITEPELSLFKRNYLFGIVITSNSLSIDGEYVDAGKSSLNILSDYETDPSVNFRDYLIYQPEGRSVRYYAMKSDLPLRDIFVSVFYRDMNNNIKPFFIDGGFTGTIKLHFRPKNTIQY